MQPLYQSSIQVGSDLGELTQVMSWFGQLEQLSVPKKAFLQCQLALAEGFTNAVRHAHKNHPTETPIDMELILFPSYLEIKIWDYGLPFEMSQAIDRLSLNTLDETAEGGRGLRLIRDIADQLSYQRTPDHRNCLSIKKYLKLEPQTNDDSIDKNL